MSGLNFIHGEKCRICGGYVCKGKAMFFSGELKNLCNSCRQKELDKLMKED